MVRVSWKDDMERIPLGSDFYYTWIERDEKRIGVMLWYDACPVHEDCRGSIPFEGYPNRTTFWQLVQEDPLTLTPSVLQRPCGFHGWITDGRWVPA